MSEEDEKENTIDLILKLRKMESENKSEDEIIKIIKLNLDDTKLNDEHKCEVWKYYLEFKCRNYIENNEKLKEIRQLFKQSIEYVEHINKKTYLDAFYFIWTEFETYKIKSVSMLNEIMSNFCQINNNIHSYRAYLYYIKTIGKPIDIRNVYKNAFNNLENDEKEIIKRNWISWEKIFGTIKTIEQTIKYIEKNIKKNTFNEIVDMNFNENIEDKKVIIKNLPENEEISEKEIENMILEKCPLLNIKNIRLVKDENGKGRGFAFIDFENNSNAKECVSNINEIKFHNNIITCALSKPPKNGENDIRTIFVNNLSYESNEKSIKNVFSKFGEILEIRIIYNKQTNKPKGYCYIEFQDKNSIDKVMENKDNIYINGRKVDIQKSISNEKLRNQVKFVVHCSNLNFKVKKETLEDFLIKEGKIEKNNILKILICKDENNKPKGYGFIEFNDKEDMDKAIKLNGKMFKGRNIIMNESKRNITIKKKKDNDNSKEQISKKRKISIDSSNDNESENNIVVKKQKITNKDFKKLFNF